MQPFNINADTFKISVTTTSSTSKIINTGSTIRLYNAGDSDCFVSVGQGSQTATVPTTTAVKTCIPIGAGSDITFNMSYVSGSDSVQIAAISESSTTLYVSVGDGI